MDRFKIYKSIIKSLSKGDHTSLKEIINENFEMKECVITQEKFKNDEFCNLWCRNC